MTPKESTSDWLGKLRRLAIWVALLLAWEGAYHIFHWKPYRFPAPSHIISSFVEMAQPNRAFGGRPLFVACIVSLGRLFAGFAVSIVLGMLIGVLMWRWKELDRLLGPVFLGLQTLPSVCWVPLGVLLFHLRERGIIFVLVMGSFFAIAIALRDGLKTIPPIYQRAGQMLGARGWKLYWYVLLPASLPAMTAGLRQGFSFAWRSLMGGELMFAVERHGLGFLLETGRNFNDVAQVVAVMIVMVVFGMAADRWVFAVVQQKVQRQFGLG